MADEHWDDEFSQSTVMGQPPTDIGRSFGRGRGFMPATSSFDSENNNDKHFYGGAENDFGSQNQDDATDRRYGRGGGRSGGRGRGGRGFSNGNEGGGGNSRYDDDDGDNSRGRRNDGFRARNNEEGDRNFGRRRDDDSGYRPRRNNDDEGESGFSRNRRNEDDDGGNRGRKGDGEDGSEKPRELYIPPEPTDDENVMFAAGISSGINFDKYDNIQVKVSGENVPKPIDRFENSGLRPFVVTNVKKSGYERPTPIQKHAIPIIMEGRDLMGCAQTGSGKTAAFLLPIINVLLGEPRELVLTAECCEPHVIIVSPTRELTLQIHNEARKFAHGSIVKTVVAYGGTAAYHQAQQVMKGCHILVATPGRLLDFVNRGRIKFSSVRFVVLDEADRMLDMGFMPDIDKMMNHTTMVPTGERQTLMFSATFPDEIQRLAAKFLSNYLFVAVGIVGGACTDVDQRFHEVARFEKRSKLTDLLKEEGGEKTLVFVEMKRTADFIAAYLSEHNFPTTSIHGDRLQREREEALADFKSGRMGILVATAVAARGLDIKNVAHVVNYDLPKSIDEYVHRIGRTGRVGNRGRATSFYDSEADGPLARDLIKILSQAEQPVPEFLEKDAEGGYGSFSVRSGGGKGAFGAKDYRKFEEGEGSGQPQTMEEEEAW